MINIMEKQTNTTSESNESCSTGKYCRPMGSCFVKCKWLQPILRVVLLLAILAGVFYIGVHISRGNYEGRRDKKIMQSIGMKEQMMECGTPSGSRMYMNKKPMMNNNDAMEQNKNTIESEDNTITNNDVVVTTDASNTGEIVVAANTGIAQ
jgi:hypothetical protein